MKKKAVCMMLTAVLAALTMAGCGGSSGSSASDASSGETNFSADSLKTLGDAMALDTDASFSSVYEDAVVYAFAIDGGYYRAKAPMSGEEAEAVLALDFMDDDYDEKMAELAGPLALEEVVELSDKILGQEKLDALTGKTGEALLKEGWEILAYDMSMLTFMMDKGPFCYTVYFEGEIPEDKIDTFDPYEEGDILTVSSAEFYGLGSNSSILEEE